MAEHDVVCRNGQVTRDVELVAATDGHAVEPRDNRLGAVLDRLDGLDEAAHPVPVIVRALKELLLLVEIGAGAEGSVASTGQDHDTDTVIRGGLPE